MHRLDEGISHFEKALRIDPNYPLAHDNLGQALMSKGQLDDAIRHYKKAIQLDPTFAAAHMNLGIALKAKGLLDEAIAQYEQALRIDSKNAKTHFNLGNAFAVKGKFAEAVNHFEQSLRINPKYARAQGALGQVLLELGRFGEARDVTRRCLELLPLGHPQRGLATQQLQRCERMLVLEGQLPDILAGKEKPAGAAEGLEFAWICQVTMKYAAAARLYSDAFAVDPKQVDNMQSAHRYRAACCATLAAAALKPNDKELPRLRRQALDWLRADLTLWEKQTDMSKAEGRALVQRVLWIWQNNPDLASVRDKEGLAMLPDPERKAWEKLWADVEALRKRAREPKSK
jgi:tetratricopeptide (TPR) repeat protein